ncbi:LOW QUALITY PROTEIN: UDP-glycosyltransferase 88A1-like [Chenopodium quinoa]|uniref:LOW QUALITY PROTEIN: UDP-glycosyltransferase 88A1-like n=1 Tax=Chenopodium quinoa TaxID=63459 RepID=UPI000B78E027|nr:LOW QUALITY PROTEIN: UDP-glycosyltransferase 88A1-like [Chenopodium quinoa]
MEKIVLYPSPGIGHLISMVELGKLLLSHSSSISITILIANFPSVSSSYSSYISSVSASFPSINFLSLPSVSLLLGDPINYENFEHILYEFLQSNSNNVKQSLESISVSSPVSAFIIDFFCYSAVEVSQSLKIPTYFFFTSGASALAFFLNFPVFDKIATDSYRNLMDSASFEIPGLFSVPASHMLEPMLDRGVSYHEFVKMAETMPKSDGIIVNTFESLEVKAVKGLKQGTCLPDTQIPPVYCIGPLFANRGGGAENNSEERHECLKWLDSQPSKSVVYLGFGSRGMFSKEQILEIALGLETSGVRFLWTVRAPPSEEKGANLSQPPDPDLDSILPEGFLDRTKDRGHVAKSWVPQIAVLGHESVGGFVSHCGWNSTLEAVDAGVPMVAWPLYVEQRFNKILIVEEIGIALPMDENEDWFVSSSEIEKRVKQILGSEGDVVRKQMLEMREKGKIALNEGQSSNVALTALMESWIH